MANQHKNGKKPQLKVQDLESKKNPKGGRKAGKGQSEISAIKAPGYK